MKGSATVLVGVDLNYGRHGRRRRRRAVHPKKCRALGAFFAEAAFMQRARLMGAPIVLRVPRPPGKQQVRLGAERDARAKNAPRFLPRASRS